jgi:hypothetical protein
MNFSFNKPLYTKQKLANGTLAPSYRFPIVTEWEMNEFIDTDINEESVNTLLTYTLDSNADMYKELLTQFQNASKTLFTKQYTVEVFFKHFKHKIAALPSLTEGPASIVYKPSNIIIINGSFILEWAVSAELARIDVPDYEETVQSSIEQLTLADNMQEQMQNAIVSPATGTSDISTELEEFDATEDDKQSTGTFELMSPSRQYELRRVKEARLRAKLAQYKAEKAYSKYVNKYGEDFSDDSDDTSDESDEEGSESDF